MTGIRWPWSTTLFFTLGSVTLAAAAAAFAGLFDELHPLLADPMAGWGLIVTAISCYLTGAFPLALRRLAERDALRAAEEESSSSEQSARTMSKQRPPLENSSLLR